MMSLNERLPVWPGAGSTKHGVVWPAVQKLAVLVPPLMLKTAPMQD